MVADGDGETLREGTLAVAEGEGEGAALREDVGDGSAVSLTVPVTDAEKETLCDREDEMDWEGWDMVGELEKDVDLVALGDTDGVRDMVEVRVGVRDVEGDRDVDREAATTMHIQSTFKTHTQGSPCTPRHSRGAQWHGTQRRQCMWGDRGSDSGRSVTARDRTRG